MHSEGNGGWKGGGILRHPEGFCQRGVNLEGCVAGRCVARDPPSAANLANWHRSRSLGCSAKVFRAGRSRDLVLLFFALSAVTSNRCTYHWCAARKFFAAFVPFSRLALIGSRFAEASIYPTGVVSLESGRSFRRPRLIGWIHGHAMCRCIRSSGNVLRCESRGDICCGNTNTKGGNGFEHGALLIAMGIHFRRGV